MASKNLENTFWKLSAFVEDGKRTAPIKGTEITLFFSVTEGIAGMERGNISGSAGCNQYGGVYTVPPGIAPGVATSISVTSVYRTLMACLKPEGVMEQEDRYLEGLLAATELEHRADMLILRWDRSALEFKPLETHEC